MTNQEIKELLSNLIGMVEDNQENDYDTALSMGIKTLEDVVIISNALIAICDHECCMYGMEEAVKLAEKYAEEV